MCVCSTTSGLFDIQYLYCRGVVDKEQMGRYLAQQINGILLVHRAKQEYYWSIGFELAFKYKENTVFSKERQTWLTTLLPLRQYYKSIPGQYKYYTN